ncbi:hypothetical protein FISHEDRAFT_5435, partial [Fistulina hepatica ATCC 64428]
YELRATEFIRRETAILVPKCERYIDATRTHTPLMVMEHVKGRALAHVWRDLSVWMKFRIALTLRFYIRELRALSRRMPQSFPGPVGDKPGPCTGRLLHDSQACGPFVSYSALTHWYNNRLAVLQKVMKRQNAYDVAPFDDSSPLVLTHLDLHMGNILLANDGRDGQLWLIDWATLGYYPEWFEASSMRF